MINLDEEEKRQIVLRFLAADSPPTLQVGWGYGPGNSDMDSNTRRGV